MHRTRTGAIERGEQNLTLRSIERIAERARLDPLALLAGAVHDRGVVELSAGLDGEDPGAQPAPRGGRLSA